MYTVDSIFIEEILIALSSKMVFWDLNPDIFFFNTGPVDKFRYLVFYKQVRSGSDLITVLETFIHLLKKKRDF